MTLEHKINILLTPHTEHYQLNLPMDNYQLSIGRSDSAPIAPIEARDSRSVFSHLWVGFYLENSKN